MQRIPWPEKDTTVSTVTNYDVTTETGYEINGTVTTETGYEINGTVTTETTGFETTELNGEGDGNEFSVGLIALIVIAAVVAIVIVLVICVRRRNQRRQDDDDSPNINDESDNNATTESPKLNTTNAGSVSEKFPHLKLSSDSTRSTPNSYIRKEAIPCQTYEMTELGATGGGEGGGGEYVDLRRQTRTSESSSDAAHVYVSTDHIYTNTGELTGTPLSGDGDSAGGIIQEAVYLAPESAQDQSDSQATYVNTAFVASQENVDIDVDSLPDGTESGADTEVKSRVHPDHDIYVNLEAVKPKSVKKKIPIQSSNLHDASKEAKPTCASLKESPKNQNNAMEDHDIYVNLVASTPKTTAKKLPNKSSNPINASERSKPEGAFAAKEAKEQKGGVARGVARGGQYVNVTFVENSAVTGNVKVDCDSDDDLYEI